METTTQTPTLQTQFNHFADFIAEATGLEVKAHYGSTKLHLEIDGFKFAVEAKRNTTGSHWNSKFTGYYTFKLYSSESKSYGDRNSGYTSLNYEKDYGKQKKRDLNKRICQFLQERKAEAKRAEETDRKMQSIQDRIDAAENYINEFNKNSDVTVTNVKATVHGITFRVQGIEKVSQHTDWMYSVEENKMVTIPNPLTVGIYEYITNDCTLRFDELEQKMAEVNAAAQKVADVATQMDTLFGIGK